MMECKGCISLEESRSCKGTTPLTLSDPPETMCCLLGKRGSQVLRISSDHATLLSVSFFFGSQTATVYLFIYFIDRLLLHQ